MTKDSTKPQPRTRNREATRGALLAAAKTTLSEQGFQAFGINAVAREAGCDKQLIYRYFDGLDGLLEAMGQDLAQWIGDAADSTGSVSDMSGETYGAKMARLADGYLSALRASPLVQKILLWELSAPIDQVRPLAIARSLALRQWMARVRGDTVPPEGVDFAVFNASIIAVVHQTVLSAASAGNFSGLSLQSEADWQRLRDGLKAMIGRLYDEGDRR